MNLRGIIGGFGGGVVKGKELIKFLGFLVRLLKVGYSVQDAVAKYKTRNQNVMRKIRKVLFYLDKGYSFSQSLKYARFCDDKIISIISAGEESSNLYDCLKTLKESIEEEEKIKNEVKKSLVLPIVELIFALVLVNLMLLKLIPMTVSSLRGSGIGLPEITQRLYEASCFYRDNLVFFVIFYFVLFFLFVFKREELKKVFYDFPMVGDIYKLSFLFSFFFQLQLYVISGASVSYAVQKIRDSLIFERERKMVSRMVSFLKRGFSLDEALEKAWKGRRAIIEDLVVVLSVVKQTGDYSDVVKEIVADVKERYAKAVSKIGVIIQPLVLVFIAAIVLLMVFAVYYPIFTANPIAHK